MKVHEQVFKRGRGRPRKIDQIEKLTIDEAEKLFKKPTRGRPRRPLYQIDGYAAFKCSQCKQVRLIGEFQLLNVKKFYFSSNCNECANSIFKENWNNRDPISRRAHGIRTHAQRDNIPYDQNIEMTLRKLWSQVPQGTGHCAYTGIPLDFNGNYLTNDHYWTIDRVIPEKGYVKGNMVLCANLINRMKQDMSIDVFLDTCLQVVRTFVEEGVSAYLRKLQTN